MPSRVTLIYGHSRALRSLILVMALAGATAVTITGCGGTPPSRSQVIEHSAQELRDAVSAKVTDENRRAQLLQIVDEMETRQQHFTQDTVQFLDGYRKLNADYDAPRAAFDQLFADYSAKRTAARDAALGLHFRLAAVATASEWDAISKAESKLYKKAIAARPTEDSSS